MAGFDPDESKEPLCQGFTSCDPDDLPSEIPSRSLADNMYGKTEITGKMRTETFSRFGDKSIESKVHAYESVQFGNAAGSQDAEDDNIPEVGNYKDNGL